MCTNFIRILFLLLIYVMVLSLGLVHAQDSTRYDRIVNALMDLSERQVLSTNVNNFKFSYASGGFTLTSGDLYLLAPVDGKRVAAMFVGEGTFMLSPPVEVERQQLIRFFEQDTLDERFSFLFMMFSDSMAAKIQKFNFLPAQHKTDLTKKMDDVFAYISDKKTLYFRTDMIKFLLDGDAPEYFYAHFYESQTKPLMFEFNPYEKESIRLMQRAELGHLYKVPEVVCQYPPNGDYSSEEKRLFTIEKFAIESTIESDLRFHATAEIKLVMMRDRQKWLPFNIYHSMIIDSVITGDVHALRFFKPEDVMVFWVESDKIVSRGDSLHLKLYYHSDDLLVKDSRSWIYLKSPNYWYPRNTLWVPSDFDLTFHYPAGMTLVSVGNRIGLEETDDTCTSSWRPVKPVTHASFNLGYFKEYPVMEPGLPDIKILKTEHGLLFRSREIEEEIAADVTGSIAFYARVYGAPPFDHLYVSEVPYGHGLAFAGLLNLSWSTFYSTEKEGYDNIFRAHEVAHQWWGIETRFESYHDQWLSESFCEFSALWYLQQSAGGRDKVSDIFNEWHELILENRSFLLSRERESGPIWLGSRTNSSQTGGDFTLSIYKKGAWVLHMLRMMFHDWQADSDERFISMMKDYYHTFKDKEARTSDFQLIVEKHLGKDMDWFFQNWIYGTELPLYRYAVEVHENPASKFDVHIRIVQDANRPLFKMPVPVEFVYDDDSREVIIINMDERQAELDLTLDREPDEINLNPGHALLAEIEEVDPEDL